MEPTDAVRDVDERRRRMHLLAWLFRRRLRRFRVVIFVYLLIFAISLLGLFLEFGFPGLNRLLAASHETPWGTFTSIFMHADALHLAVNMAGLTLYLFYFIFTNFYHSMEEIRRRAIFVSLLVFVSAAFSNFLWIFLYPNQRAIGSSGLVYAFVGATFGFALSNLIVFAVSGDGKDEDLKTLAQVLSPDSARKFLLTFKAVSYISNIVFLVYLALAFFSSPEQFLNLGPQVNGFVHALSFYAGFVAASAYSLWMLFGLLRRR